MRSFARVPCPNAGLYERGCFVPNLGLFVRYALSPYFIYTIKSMISELRMPEMRAAWPRVRGRTVSSFWRVSVESAGIEA